MKMKKLVKKITDFFGRVGKKHDDAVAEQQEILKTKLAKKILSKREKLANCMVKKEQKQLEKEIHALEKLERKLNEE